MGRPRYFLQAWPRANVEVEGILARDFDSLRRRMSHPNELRRFGWGMRSGVAPSDLPDGGLRIVSDRLTLSLRRSGLLSLIAAADSAYLAWADEQRKRLNSLLGIALVESTLEFMRFFTMEVMPRCRPQIGGWAIAGGMADLVAGENATSLHEGITTTFFLEWHQAVISAFQFGPIDLKGDETAGRGAYLALREAYLQFGMDEGLIPYAEDGEICEEAIMAIKS